MESWEGGGDTHKQAGDNKEAVGREREEGKRETGI